MAEQPSRRLEDVECPILNEAVIRKYHGIMKGMGADPANVRSPGLKVQIKEIGPLQGYNQVYCEHCTHGQVCEISRRICLYLKA